MVIEKRDCALLVKFFLSEWQQKQCCIEGISPHERTLKRTHVNKWVKEDDDEIQKHCGFGVAPGKGRQTIAMEVVDEVAVAVTDHTERAPNSSISA